MNQRVRTPLASPGATCESDLRGLAHAIHHPHDDVDLQRVRRWLMATPLQQQLTFAVNDAVEYVLDGARTWRFDLQGADVDADERRTFGTKVQYRIIGALRLAKVPPLDTIIEGIPVELKGTVGSSWMIPRESQCEIFVLVQVDAANDRHRALLMRTHRQWLNAPNQDQKRSIRSDALHAYGSVLIPWTLLPRSPLKDLTRDQQAVVFDPAAGQAKRLTALFGFLPGVVIPRSAILTVCANRSDPMRRVRELREIVLGRHGLRLLCGTWMGHLMEAADS